MPSFETKNIPDKKYFQRHEVTSLVGIKAAQLKQWEEAFPQLLALRASRQAYSFAEVSLLMEIKKLVDTGKSLAETREIIAEKMRVRAKSLEHIRQELQNLLNLL